MSEFGRQQVTNSKLRIDDVPLPEATWSEIQVFALSFDGYQHWGSFERCAEIANCHEHDTLTKLRTCLFFEQRRWRHFGEEPDAAAWAELHKILDGIRAKLHGDERA